MERRIEAVMKKYWGLDGFLPLQEEAMECVLAGRDSIVVLPTGGGKSLCFQAPAVTMTGLAVVISPLISLMKDQVDALVECGIPAAPVSTLRSRTVTVSSVLPWFRRAVARSIEACGDAG